MTKFTDDQVTTLKTYFNTGDTPTEAEFHALIDAIQEGIEEHDHEAVGDGDAANVDTTEVADAAVTTAKLDNSAVTTIKIAAGAVGSSDIAAGAVVGSHLATDSVDDTKVGNRVPQFRRRQGGHATHWQWEGSTDYTPTTVRMQAGVGLWTGTAAVYGSLTVTFPEAFGAKPIVIATAQEWQTVVSVPTANTTTTTCRLDWYAASTETSVVISWFAIGPE